jgi:tRNA A37 threonylcarbamoyladenosine dehydratase
MDPLSVRLCDLSDTYEDPFAAQIRRGLKKQYGIGRGAVTAVLSLEPCKRSSLALTSTATRFKRSYFGACGPRPPRRSRWVALRSKQGGGLQTS